MKLTFTKSRWLLLPVLVLIPSIVLAHTGVGPASGFAHGFAHPFSGLDHMLAMLAVGIWATQMSDRAVWVVPLTFVGVMLIGGVLGISGVTIPFVEEGIVLSVLVLGILIAVAVRFPLVASAAIVGLFALFHGHSHGEEISAAVNGLTYGIGFAMATIMLHATGIGFGLIFKNTKRVQVVRYAGVAITLLGVYLLIP